MVLKTRFKSPGIFSIHLILVIIYFIVTGNHIFAQISHGGQPASFHSNAISRDIEQVFLSPPEMDRLAAEDARMIDEGLPPRIAVSVPVNRSIQDAGTWTVLADGTRTWRLMLHCPGALAMNISFSKFHIPVGGQLFIYNPSEDFVIGAFTEENNRENKLFATQLIPGDMLVIEYDQKGNIPGELLLEISDISYAYRFIPDFITGVRTAGDCEVNINCPEGDNWQDQKRGVARIYIKDGTGYYWCSGSLVNNTQRNRTPYFLTADHCAPDVSPVDLAQWIFYFNFEEKYCDASGPPPPTNQTMTGATLMAHAGTQGSDFMLLLLDDSVPEIYNPFFNGWNRENSPSPSGVSIHHAQGEVKVISTYTQPLQSASWYGIPGTHWEVYWSQTETGWGVVEQGSSGAPLFDNNGRIVGTLTGGSSSCDSGDLEKPDYFGKFFYSWDQNGSSPSERLKEWLDPSASGVMTLSGINAVLAAGFDSDARIILVGHSVQFTDNSSGDPKIWLWHFDGGFPDSYEGNDPPSITYPYAGNYDVSLIVSRDDKADTLIRKEYVKVIGRVYPNPADDIVHIFIDEEPPPYLKIEMYNLLGMKLFSEERYNNTSAIIDIDVSNLSSGFYPMRIQVGQEYLLQKVLVAR